MSVRAQIETHMKIVTREQNRQLAKLHDGLRLLDSGLDSLCFAILVTRLEDEFGVDPFAEGDDESFPETLGQFVAYYDRAMA